MHCNAAIQSAYTATYSMLILLVYHVAIALYPVATGTRMLLRTCEYHVRARTYVRTWLAIIMNIE